MFEYLSELILFAFKPLGFLVQPGKRLYWLYLLTGLLLGLAVYRNQIGQVLKQSLRAKYWLNQSTKVDVKWIATNQVLAFVLLMPLITAHLAWAMTVYRSLSATFGVGDYFDVSTSWVMVLFSFTIFLAEDFSRFFVHYCYHKVPFLWRFHAIHHSAKVMTPITLYRIHFIEYAVNTLRSLSVTGTISGVFMYLFVGKIGLFEVFGVSIFTLVFNLLGANLRHSHLWVSFGKFEQLFISPAQHQIHHSSASHHLDKNFGATLAIWDKLFNTWLASENQQVKRFGLFKQANRQSWRAQWWGIKR